MHLDTQETLVEDLTLGMYVSRLDVPWVQTPFPIQGFQITKDEELELLSHYCNKVYVDIKRSKVDVAAKLNITSNAKPGKGEAQFDAATLRLMKEKARFKPRVTTYQALNKMKKEVKASAQMYDKITTQMADIYERIQNNGAFEIKEITVASNAMVKSVISNPDALAWLCRINTASEKLHQQAVRSAIWALIFARHLGLSESDLHDLGTALLLAPIGKTKIDSALLKNRSSANEVQQFNEHVSLTLAETKQMFSPNHQINYIIASYCERNNGTGYPRNLIGNKIPFLARVAGIADYYEQLINPYSSDAAAMTPSEAISHLYNIRGNLFQLELVESFIQAIGVYPTGSLVELNDKSVAIVLEQPENAKLRPSVAILKDSADKLCNKPETINLAKEGVNLLISKSLSSTSHDIDAKTIHQSIFGSSGWFSFS
ncbi:MAG: DUF3391 domain-containing protein [Gammaproteobacteria bacterium]|nr:DUF3391 domain-containing protein [Gammaproteobacteria bacterium]MDH5628579.1 DUF3391 domain-containing protein [Gammaproteobacteria bacterium]